MNDVNQPTVLNGILIRGYQKVFDENWPVWVGGILIGLMSVLTFAWARPWGGAGGKSYPQLVAGNSRAAAYHGRRQLLQQLSGLRVDGPG